VKEIGGLLPSDVASLEQLAKTGADIIAINKELARIAKVQVKTIKRIIKDAAENTYTNAKPFFDYRRRTFIPFEENESVQRVVNAISKQTSGTYVNLAKAQAFMVRDPKNPKVLKPTPIARTYQNTVDKAVQAVQSGVTDYQSTMRQSLNDLVDSGIKSVTYHPESGRTYTQRLDSAVRRNVLDGVRAVNQGVQNELGSQFGADGVEITVHACPAPDHQYVQGHQFAMAEWAKMAPVESIQENGNIDTSVYAPSEEDIVDVNGKHYKPFKRRIGTCNCKHFAYNIIIGHAPQNYTDEQLQEILDENEKGVEVDGKHYTKYEATQIQRQLELKIRQARERYVAMKAAGDEEAEKKAKEKAVQYLHEYKDFSDKAGLRMKLDRIKVEGYR
jgi:hypothetical protein